MADIKWYDITDLYTIKDYKITHRKDPVTKWIKLPCVYKIKINNQIVNVWQIRHLQETRRCRKGKEGIGKFIKRA